MIKLSFPATQDFWEIAVLYEDEHLLALNKPSGLLTSPDRNEPERPSLLSLLHAGIGENKPWARARRLAYLMNAHRLDAETSGVLLFARSKLVLVSLANWFGSEQPGKKYVALAQGEAAEERFEVEAKLAPHPFTAGLVRVDARGKHARTLFTVRERFAGWTLLTCEPIALRPHQFEAHLQHIRLPLVGARPYGGRLLLLSRLKRAYRLKPNQTERPLLSRPALHAEELTLPHPVTGQPLVINAPWPRDLTVAVKYLRRYAAVGAKPADSDGPD